MAIGIKIDREHLKPVPVGNSGWADFSQKCYTVDKTLLIKELLDDQTTVALFTRPRRFGKTTALRMLYCRNVSRGCHRHPETRPRLLQEESRTRDVVSGAFRRNAPT